MLYNHSESTSSALENLFCTGFAAEKRDTGLREQPDYSSCAKVMVLLLN